VLMPQTRKSPNGGSRRSKTTGRFFDLAVGLGQRGEGDVAFVHGRRSATVYSGSWSP
jgi:hypothetical protein